MPKIAQSVPILDLDSLCTSFPGSWLASPCASIIASSTGLLSLPGVLSDNNNMGEKVRPRPPVPFHMWLSITVMKEVRM